MFGQSKRARKPGYGKKYQEEMKKPSRWKDDGVPNSYGLAGVKQEGTFLRTSSGRGGSIRTVWFPPDKEQRIL
jgi:hypothetical protein